MPKGFHYGRCQTRNYTSQYSRISAKVFKSLISAPVGHYRINGSSFSEEHQNLELTEFGNNGRLMTFIIDKKPHQVALNLDNRSASNKLYITCPYCRKQRQHLYVVKTAYACRECLKLSYASQSEGKKSRLARRIRKQRHELWGASYPDINNMFENIRYWPKPKWMCWKTFERKRDEIIALEAQYWPIAIDEVDKLCG
jgi:hypothetical protein